MINKKKLTGIIIALAFVLIACVACNSDKNGTTDTPGTPTSANDVNETDPTPTESPAPATTDEPAPATTDEPGIGEDIDPGTGEDVEPGTGEDIDPGTGEDVEPGKEDEPTPATTPETTPETPVTTTEPAPTAPATPTVSVPAGTRHNLGAFTKTSGWAQEWHTDGADEKEHPLQMDVVSKATHLVLELSAQTENDIELILFGTGNDWSWTQELAFQPDEDEPVTTVVIDLRKHSAWSAVSSGDVAKIILGCADLPKVLKSAFFVLG